jgi:SEC-C motif-containing protein
MSRKRSKPPRTAPRQPSCPCGLGPPYDDCCGPLLRGEQQADSPERLMRSRYTAYARGDTAYVLQTWHSSTRPAELRLDPALHWRALEVVSARGGLLDVEGEVEFRARSSAGVLAERSRFVREGGRWRYLSGEPC